MLLYYDTLYYDISSIHCESIIIRVNVPGIGYIFLCCIYRPPQTNFYHFCDFIEYLFDHFQDKNVMLLGDMNIDVCNISCSRTLYYNNLLVSYGYKNEICISTHVNQVTNQNGSCIDHIIHNMDNNVNSYVLTPKISDHYAVAAIFPINVAEKLVQIKFRDFSQNNIAHFKSNMQQEFSRFGSLFHNIDAHTDYIIDFLKKLLEKYFPIKTKKISEKNMKTPWITKKVRLCIKKKHKWSHLADQKLISSESYKMISSKLKELLRVAKSEYFTNKFHSLRNDGKNNWKILNNLMGKKTKLISDRFNLNGILSHDPHKIAIEFNKFFINHPINIQHNIPNSSIDFSNLVSINQTSADFQSCSCEEVFNEINSIKKSGGIHDISGKFLKLCSSPLSEILTELYNRCLIEGIYPTAFKTAIITPVFKKGSSIEISNHRPISVLPNLSKIFDSIIYKRVKYFFEDNGLLNPDQFGFRTQRNTELAIFTLLERVIPSFQNPSFSISVFLDFSACFDTVHRGSLLYKLERYGIRDKELRLISSYFDCRYQSVIYNNSKSPNLQQNLGTIQGSRTGTLYFDIFSGDLSKICFEDEFIMFADDTCLTYAGDNLPQLVEYVNKRLELIYEWCCYNKLSLNASKCKFMIFTNKKYDNQNLPPIKLGNDCIDRVTNFKYLGIFIDEKLNYDYQLKSLETKISRMCGITFRIKNNLNLNSAKNVYYSCIYSILIYCICVWGGLLTCTHKTDRLIKLHVRCIKNLFSKFCPVDVCIFKYMKLLKLKDLHWFYVGIYMFKVIKLNQCPTVQLNLNMNFPEHNYDTRSGNNPRLPFPRIDTVKMNYNFQFVNLWNKIPDRIKSSNSLKIFKNDLMNYFIEKY